MRGKGGGVAGSMCMVGGCAWWGGGMRGGRSFDLGIDPVTLASNLT